jgi:hypothetical protein
LKSCLLPQEESFSAFFLLLGALKFGGPPETQTPQPLIKSPGNDPTHKKN